MIKYFKELQPARNLLGISHVWKKLLNELGKYFQILQPQRGSVHNVLTFRTLWIFWARFYFVWTIVHFLFPYGWLWYHLVICWFYQKSITSNLLLCILWYKCKGYTVEDITIFDINMEFFGMSSYTIIFHLSWTSGQIIFLSQRGDGSVIREIIFNNATQFILKSHITQVCIQVVLRDEFLWSLFF